MTAIGIVGVQSPLVDGVANRKLNFCTGVQKFVWFSLLDFNLLSYASWNGNFKHAYQVYVIMLERNVDKQMRNRWQQIKKMVILAICEFVRHPSHAYVINTYDFDQYNTCITCETNRPLISCLKNPSC